MSERERTELPPGHFDCIPRAVWKLRRAGRISGADIDALATLVYFARSGKQLVLSSLHYIAGQTDWGKGNLQRSVKRLIAAGLVVPVRHPKYARNAYMIVWDPETVAECGERPARAETDSGSSPVDNPEAENGLGAEAESGLGTEAGKNPDSTSRPQNGLDVEAETAGADDPPENGLDVEAADGLDVESRSGLDVEAAQYSKRKNNTKRGRGAVTAGPVPRERSPPGKEPAPAGDGFGPFRLRRTLDKTLERGRKARAKPQRGPGNE